MTASHYDLTPGTRVTVISPEEYARETGVVIDVPDRYFNAYDVCVQMDSDGYGDAPRCFMVDELQVQP
jgi:hypothetical protein